tara:strand:+ start:1209 stop:1529 length:321 start_codon:yes stop_codon:yes gene_type:complete
MEGVLQIDNPCFARLDDLWIIAITIACVLAGVWFGMVNKQVICKTLQPIIHKYNIHHLVPVKEVPVPVVDLKDDDLKESDPESENEHQLAVEEVAEEVLEQLKKTD